MRVRALALVLAGGLGVACEPLCTVSNRYSLEPGEHTGPTMRPGNNCLRCHSENGEASSHPFSVGGTVFERADASACDGVAGVRIEVTDSEGKTVNLLSNSVGNFFSEEPLRPPLSMAVRHGGKTATMPITTPTGGCALCHSWPDPVSAVGRVRVP